MHCHYGFCLVPIQVDRARFYSVIHAQLIAHMQLRVATQKLDACCFTEGLLDIFLVDLSALSLLFEHHVLVIFLNILYFSSRDSIVMIDYSENVSHALHCILKFAHIGFICLLLKNNLRKE